MANKTVTYEMMHNAMHNVITGLQNNSDDMKPAKAKEITNACGKVISMGIGRLQFALKNGISLDVPELGIGDMELSSLPPSNPTKRIDKGKDFLEKCRD